MIQRSSVKAAARFVASNEPEPRIFTCACNRLGIDFGSNGYLTNGWRRISRHEYHCSKLYEPALVTASWLFRDDVFSLHRDLEWPITSHHGTFGFLWLMQSMP